LVNIRHLALLALPVLAGCSYLPPLPDRPRDVFTTPIVNRGHAVSEDQIAQLTPGVSSRADVQALLGSPSHAGTFSDDNWYYISAVTQQRPARTMALRSQRVVVIAFNPAGTVAEVRQLSQDDMPRVAFVVPFGCDIAAAADRRKAPDAPKGVACPLLAARLVSAIRGPVFLRDAAPALSNLLDLWTGATPSGTWDIWIPVQPGQVQPVPAATPSNPKAPA
jgi:outer membrane protein assembly factor BamE (lipoprotein component of BamABCDE complex)